MEEILLKNPWVRSLLPLVLMGASSVFASSLVVEIANGNQISWHEIPQKVSFYVLLICTILLCLYQVAISRHDTNLIRGLTPKQYEAALRIYVAEESAKRAKKLIKEGSVDQLIKETEAFKKLFGEALK
ncbi:MULTISPECIES: hypothetical protein [Aeromonas]|uniref:hypothetical protein n=1 Tax=Aeromonas TaxID=642 RepID=UPI00191E61A0|nr:MULTISPECIES: hypothetical protein [Aeromonas]MBL0460823.1 hypothetical protein [Aeromonas dhakensis]QXC06308.1 hypothetical protein I6L38_11125 [Aeromonas sp. FDAARGOS 1408]UCM51883.1 hypothetical protein LEO81_13660 [Aeromonas dhakensis]